MKKFKYILATVVLAMGFASCETETIDEKLKDDTLKATPILRFELNDQQTVVTDRVNLSWPTESSITITAKFSVINAEDPSNETRYKPATLVMTYNYFAVGHFPTKLNIQNPTLNVLSANLNVQGVGDYSTMNAKETEDAGYSNVTNIFYEEKFIEGNFDLILYPTPGSNQPIQRLRNGQYNYIKY